MGDGTALPLRPEPAQHRYGVTSLCTHTPVFVHLWSWPRDLYSSPVVAEQGVPGGVQLQETSPGRSNQRGYRVG